MRVISLINGSLAAETTAIYALHYAKKLEFNFSLVYIGDEDFIENVNHSVKNITNFGSSLDMECEYLTFKDILEFKEFVENRDIDMLFCSTRDKHYLLDNSFAKKLIKKKIKADLSIIKVVKLCRAKRVDKIVLPIRGEKLSVKKFAIFSSFALAYNSKAEIYSVDRVSKSILSKIDTQLIKYRLKEIIFNLRHYLKIAKMMDFKFSIKHDFALIEGDRVKEHIAKHSYDLVIIGAHHNNSFFGYHPIDVLFSKPMINTLYFIPHKDDI